MIEEVLLGLDVGSLVFIMLTMLIFSTAKRFEKEGVRPVFNLMNLCLSLVFIVVSIDLIGNLRAFSQVSRLVTLDLSQVNNVLYLGIIPFIAVLFLAILFYIRELS